MEQQLELLILGDLDPYPPNLTRRASPPPNVRRAIKPGAIHIVFLLHLACCGLPLLIAFGAFGATGALLANPGVAGAVVLVGVLVAARVVSRGRSTAEPQDDCCLPVGRAERPHDVGRADPSDTRDIAA